MPFRSTLLAAGLGVLLLAGCGSENTALIPQDDADQLTALVSEAGDAIVAGECDGAHRAVAGADRDGVAGADGHGRPGHRGPGLAARGTGGDRRCWCGDDQ